jgi:hypothetical protein
MPVQAEGGNMKRTRLAILLLPLVALPLLFAERALAGKPKVDVQVKVNEGVGKNPPADSLSRTGSSYDGSLQSATIFYLNVTVTSDNADAVAKSNGQWCIKGDALLSSLTYHGTLSGNDLELEVPQPNGKIKKMSFVVYDRKWRKLADI